MDLNCRSVSGRMAARTTTVRAMIETPHCSPTLSWKNIRTASNTSISGWKMLAKTVTVRGVAPGGAPNRRCASTGSKPPWLNGLQRSTRHPARTSPRSMPYRWIACVAYVEQLGSYLQRVPNSGEMNRW